MASWGVALAVGPKYNDIDIDLSREKAAVGAMQKASALASRVSDSERGYMKALSKRYSADPNADRKQLALDYKQAIGELMRLFAQGMAFSATGRPVRAAADRDALLAETKTSPADTLLGLNTAHGVLDITALMLDASIARARQDCKQSAELFDKAATTNQSGIRPRANLWAESCSQTDGTRKPRLRFARS